MSSYFDEHDCAPLADGESPDGLLHFARFLVTSGNWNDEAFSALFADKPPPPTSKSFMESLPTRVLRDDLDKECPICLKKFEQDDELTCLPCEHEFHSACVEAWLNKAANCPMCRSVVSYCIKQAQDVTMSICPSVCELKLLRLVYSEQ